MPAFDTGMWVNPGAHLLDTAEDTGESLPSLCRKFGVHPALRQALLAWRDRASNDRAEIMRDYRQIAASFEEHDVLSLLEGDYSPVAQENYERIHDALEDLQSCPMGDLAAHIRYAFHRVP